MAIKNKIKKLLFPDRRLWYLPKRYLKRRRFKKYSTFGKELVVSAKSNCQAERAGLIHIGDYCIIIGKLESQSNGKITIGDYTAIHEHSIVGSVERVDIGSYVMISNHVHIYDNNNHPVDPDERRNICLQGHYSDASKWKHAVSAPIVIEDDVWIGEYVTILKGVTVGKGSVIASHSVVTKDVPPYTIAAGNPARIVKEINHGEK